MPDGSHTPHLTAAADTAVDHVAHLVAGLAGPQRRDALLRLIQVACYGLKGWVDDAEIAEELRFLADQYEGAA